MYAGDDVRRQQRKDKIYTYYPSVQTAIIQVNYVVLRYSKMPKKTYSCAYDSSVNMSNCILLELTELDHDG